MSEGKFTPGPLLVSNHRGSVRWDPRGGKDMAYGVGPESDATTIAVFSSERAIHDAMLFVAAPGLLEGCREAIAVIALALFRPENLNRVGLAAAAEKLKGAIRAAGEEP